MIDFGSDRTELVLNPRMPAEERERLLELQRSAPSLPAHVWLATSGTTGSIKLVALSKRAILASAEAVNAHLDATSSDVWCCVLPDFHAGGLGIHARAFLSGSRVTVTEWDPRRFAEGGFTLASLVPAQVRDLVDARLQSPADLRAIVVGGGALSNEFYAAAREFGWAVLPSYGLTETASQIATATIDSPELRILRHAEVRIVEERIAVRGPSLLTGYAFFDERGTASFADPKTDGWFVTEDRGDVDGRLLRVFGRSSDFVKIGGESVDLVRLDRILDSVRGGADAAVVAVPDARLGRVIHLAVTSEDATSIVEAFNARVLPFERIRSVHRVAEIPRTALGKIRRAELLERLP